MELVHRSIDASGSGPWNSYFALLFGEICANKIKRMHKFWNNEPLHAYTQSTHVHTATGTRELARAAFVSFRGRWGQNGPRGDTRSAAAHVLRFSEFEIWKQVFNGNTQWKLASGFVHVHHKCCTLRVSIVCSPRVLYE